MSRVSGAVALALALFILPAQSGAETSNGGAAFGTQPVSKIGVKGDAVVGERELIRGVVGAPGSPVFIQVKRGAGEWVDVGTAGANNKGHFKLAWSPEQDGRHTVRAATVPFGSQAATANSALEQRVMVFKPARATWYGPGLYGNRTACGKRLTVRTIGVAHRTLPCGTRVAISFGGKQTVARVIDRGPFAHGADWDLTTATARRVGMTTTSEVLVAPLR